MSTFQEYMNPDVPLEERLGQAFVRCGVSDDEQERITSFLAVLKLKDEASYRHSVRVGIVAGRIGEFMHLDARALLYAGLLHDAGKALTRLDTLQKTEDWTPADAEEMERHVMDSYRLLAGAFDFSAEIALWHHRFQRNGYPEELPEPLHEYSEGTKVQIAFYGRLLALADVYDALHRVNSRFGAITGEQIREKMHQFNPDQRKLLDELYDNDVFTVELVETASD